MNPTPSVDPSLPAELRFLASQGADPAEQQRIIRAYYSFANGSPESASVAFALVASALLKANIQLQAEAQAAARQSRTLAWICALLSFLTFVGVVVILRR